MMKHVFLIFGILSQLAFAKLCEDSLLTIAAPLSTDELALFKDEKQGLLVFLKDNLTGLWRNPREKMIELAINRISDFEKRTQALNEIRELKITPSDYKSARGSGIDSANRLYRALEIIAKYSSPHYDSSIKLLDRKAGMKHLGFYEVVPLNKKELDQFRNEETGAVAFLAKEIPGFLTDTKNKMKQLAQQVVKDPEKLKKVLEDFEIIGLYDHYGSEVLSREDYAAHKLQAALEAIAGSKVITREDVIKKLKFDRSQLNDSEFSIFIHPENGLLGAFCEEFYGFSDNTTVHLTKILKERFSEPLLSKLLEAVENAKLKKSEAFLALNGNRDAAARLHSLFSQLYKLITSKEPPLFMSSETLGVFKIQPIQLNDNLNDVMLSKKVGVLPYLRYQYVDFYNNTVERVFEIAKNNISDPQKLAEVQQQISEIGLLARDGSYAKEGKKRSASRIAYSLGLIAKAKFANAPKHIVLEDDFIRMLVKRPRYD